MSKEFEPFAPNVCQKLRNLVSARKRAIAKRDNLFKTRDGLKADLDATSSGEKDKRLRLHAEYGETVLSIESYKRAIARIDGDIDDAVENADDSKLFSDPGVDMGEYLADPVKPDPKASSKPVGGPSAKEPPKKPAIAKPEPALQISGVDEHLAASVNELDLGEYEKGKLVQAEFNTVGDVAKLLDSPDEPDLQAAFNLSPRQVANVCRAVKKFRTTHREAMRKAEGVA